MSLKDVWVDKKDGVDVVRAKDINDIASAIIDIENDMKNDDKDSFAQSLSGNEEDKAPSVKAVNEGLGGKVDKVNAKRIVYGTGNNGEPVTRYLRQTPSMNAVPQYSSDGRLQTNAPVADLDCVNKKTMDDGLASKLSLPSKLGAWCLIGIGEYNAETGEYTPQKYTRDWYGSGNATIAAFALATDATKWIGKNPRYTLGVADPLYPIQVANKRYVDNKYRDLEHSVHNALGVLYTFESVKLGSPYNEIPDRALSIAYLESIGGANVYSHATGDRVLVGTTDIVAIHINGANSERLSTYEPTAPQYIELPAGAVSIVFEYREPTVTVWDTLEIDASIKYQIKVGA